MIVLCLEFDLKCVKIMKWNWLNSMFISCDFIFDWSHSIWNLDFLFTVLLAVLVVLQITFALGYCVSMNFLLRFNFINVFVILCLRFIFILIQYARARANHETHLIVFDWTVNTVCDRILFSFMVFSLLLLMLLLMHDTNCISICIPRLRDQCKCIMPNFFSFGQRNAIIKRVWFVIN